MLCVNRFHSMPFCSAEGFGMCRMFRSSSRQLLMHSHSSTSSEDSFSHTLLIRSTTALVDLVSENASLLVVNKWFISRTVARATHSKESSVGNRDSMGRVRFRRILMTVSTILLFFVLMRTGMRSLRVFWPEPIARR